MLSGRRRFTYAGRRLCDSLTTGFGHYVVQGEAPSDKLYTSATLRPQLLGVISPPLRVLQIARSSRLLSTTHHKQQYDVGVGFVLWRDMSSAKL
ncbi:hypothetical protein J6590_100636 [Homalodisca vitripennis]|nr:hypothetical protein J6590_100636 [Homalodisca vitripennis]